MVMVKESSDLNENDRSECRESISEPENEREKWINRKENVKSEKMRKIKDEDEWERWIDGMRKWAYHINQNRSGMKNDEKLCDQSNENSMKIIEKFAEGVNEGWGKCSYTISDNCDKASFMVK